MHIRDKEIRRRLSDTFRRVGTIEGFEVARLKHMDNLLAFARMRKSDALADVRGHLLPNFSAAYAHLGALSALSLGMIIDEDRPLPPDWLGATTDSDPNSPLSHNLLQMVNHGTAVLSLIERGLTNSARSLLRTLIEATWTTVLYCGDRQKAKQYAKPMAFSEARAVWQQHFSPRASVAALERIERSLGLDAEMAEYLSEHRKGIYELHTQSAHNTRSVMGMLAFDTDLAEELNNDTRCTPALYGRAGAAAKATIEDVIDVLGYAVLMLFLIFRVLHPYTSNGEDKFWGRAQSFAIGSLGIWLGSIGFEPFGKLWGRDEEDPEDNA